MAIHNVKNTIGEHESHTITVENHPPPSLVKITVTNENSKAHKYMTSGEMNHLILVLQEMEKEMDK